MKRDHLLGFFQVNEFTAPTPAEKERIHLARVSRTLAKEDKLRRAYSGGNVISAREKDKLETAKLEKPKAPEASPPETWQTGLPQLWGKFKVRLEGSTESYNKTLVFHKGFWYGSEFTSLDDAKVKAEDPRAHCSQDCWEWQTIPGEHYIIEKAFHA